MWNIAIWSCLNIWPADGAVWVSCRSYWEKSLVGEGGSQGAESWNFLTWHHFLLLFVHPEYGYKMTESFLFPYLPPCLCGHDGLYPSGTDVTSLSGFCQGTFISNEKSLQYCHSRRAGVMYQHYRRRLFSTESHSRFYYYTMHKKTLLH